MDQIARFQFKIVRVDVGVNPLYLDTHNNVLPMENMKVVHGITLKFAGEALCH
jgi:hypothetical protein